MARTKAAEIKGRETIAKRRENNGKAGGQTRKIIAGILGEKGKDKLYKEREVRTWKKGKETKEEGNVGGYKRPVNARNLKEGTDHHHQTPNKNDNHRGDEEDDTKAKATNDSGSGTKTLTGQDKDKDKDHKGMHKTHTGEHARDRNKEDANNSGRGAQHAKASDIEDTNSKDNTARDTDGRNSYPLVGPRTEEAPDNDDGTLEQSTGTEGSTEHIRDVMNKTPYSQYRDTNARDHNGRLGTNTKDNTNRDTNGNDTYPLVGPRPEEAPDNDVSTLEQSTGTGTGTERTHSVTHSLTHSLTHALTHSLTHLIILYSKGHYFTKVYGRTDRPIDRPTTRLLELLRAAKNFMVSRRNQTL